MSFVNARKHWRFLVTVAVIFVALAAAGPLLFYGLGPLFGTFASRFGDESVLIMAAIFAVVTLGWLFFVLWVGDRADRVTTGGDEKDANG